MLHAETAVGCTRCHGRLWISAHKLTDLCPTCQRQTGYSATPAFIHRLNAGWAHQRDVLKANPDGRNVPFSPFQQGGAKHAFVFAPKVVK